MLHSVYNTGGRGFGPVVQRSGRCTTLQLGRGTPSCNHNNGPAKWGSVVARRVLCSYAISLQRRSGARAWQRQRSQMGFPIRQLASRCAGPLASQAMNRCAEQRATGPVCPTRSETQGSKMMMVEKQAQIRYENQPSCHQGVRIRRRPARSPPNTAKP